MEGMEPLQPPRAPIAVTKTVIGSGSRVVGELFADEDIVVEGRIEGKIHGERGVLVAQAGDIEGDVEGKSIVVSGKVRGQVSAGERAELTGTAVVEGGVEAPKIIIAEGAVLQGRIAMSSPGSPRPPSSETKRQE